MKIKYFLVIGIFSLIYAVNLSAEVLDREILVVSPRKIITQKVKTVMTKSVRSPRISEIYFKTGSSIITKSQMEKISKLSPEPGEVIHINGYTSDAKRENNNIKLSKKRAETVKKILNEKFPGAEFIVRFYGSSKMKYSNKTVRGRNGNQRVLIKIK
jgi:outer membrane protein OmpA-like peptidoglycan-associated protein